MTTSKAKHARARKFLQNLAGGPLTLGSLLSAIREGEGMTQAEFADKLGVSRSHLCDIEKGRKTVGPARAARFAAILGHSPESFVALALQAQVQAAGLKLTVTVTAA